MAEGGSAEGARRSSRRPRRRSIFADADAMPISGELISGCLDRTQHGDQLFELAWRYGCSSLNGGERSKVAGITGHIAESVVEIVFDTVGWSAIWHHPGPGRHGVDLAFLTPQGMVVVAEVKGTLVARRTPRLTPGELAQMSAEWVDKSDNPAMASLELRSADVYGMVIAINLADLTLKAVVTTDFTTLHSVGSLAEAEAALTTELVS